MTDVNGSLPTVTVVIPVYNAARTLRRAIASVLAQDECKLDVVVIDDGSTDDTPVVLEDFKGQVRQFRQTNQGVGAARNTGIDKAIGDFIAFLDSDDEWLPGKLRKQLALFAQDPIVDVVYGGATYVNRDGRPRYGTPVYLRRDEVTARLSHGNFISTSSVVARSRCFGDGTRFPSDLRLGEDYVLWLHLATAGRHFDCVPETLIRYTVANDPAKYPVEEYIKLFDLLERVIRDASALTKLQRQQMLKHRGAMSTWDTAVLYAQQRKWLSAVRAAGAAWVASPLGLRGVAHFLWHGVARLR